MSLGPFLRLFLRLFHVLADGRVVQRDKYYENMTITCHTDIFGVDFQLEIVMNPRSTTIPLRIVIAALAFISVVAHRNPETALAGEYVGEDPEVVADATRALEAFERWERLGDTIAYLEFVDARDDTAEHVALGSGFSPAELQAAWASGDLHGQRAALAALSQLGVPYKRFAAQEGVSFDCSGLTGFAWEWAGVELPRSSRNQYRSSTRVDREDALVGDLAWYPGHIMLYLGIGDLVVHSPTRGRTVEYGTLSEHRASWTRFADPMPVTNP